MKIYLTKPTNPINKRCQVESFDFAQDKLKSRPNLKIKLSDNFSTVLEETGRDDWLWFQKSYSAVVEASCLILIRNAAKSNVINGLSQLKTA